MNMTVGRKSIDFSTSATSGDSSSMPALAIRSASESIQGSVTR